VADDTPSDLKYTDQHEWVRDDGEVVRVGITYYAQDQLGDVVYVDLPSPGAEVRQGQPFGEVESTKSVSDLFAPVTGVVEERNDELDDHPELVNADPYGQGWMLTIRPSDRCELDGLLDDAGYDALTTGD
jgi:glycine cleavage system H protein